ncbi:hypothetical protein BDV30DRAFT_246443 [Aspergillus minisclerotigenes]|uniref:Uncharacterized protein n=1 Tax=Aspergillus minisclerotigenes TaxID=656917 RepID=A0A5N6JCP3_9EURO|nr:hypothetical protein BDV30DRAFT_246443 [Aspergillus minisclerotigenes]
MDVLKGKENFRQLIISCLEKTDVVYRHLARILQETTNLTQMALTSGYCNELNIKLSSLELERISRNETLAFYEPLLKSDIPALDWGKVRFSEWTEGDSEESRRVDITLDNLLNRLREAWLRNNEEHILERWTHGLTSWLMQLQAYEESAMTGEHTPDVPYEWQITRHVKASSTSNSHCIFRVLHYADPEEPLRRSEILPIVSHMKERMTHFDLIQHYAFPPPLHIKSKSYDFEENSHENYELFMRWICGVPCGSTKKSLPIEGKRLSNRRIKMIDELLGSYEIMLES